MPPSSSIPNPKRSYNEVYTPQSPDKLDISILPDPFLAGPFSASPSRSRPPQPKTKPKTRRYDTKAAQRGRAMEHDLDDTNVSQVRSSQPPGETEPLLPRTGEMSERARKPFYRPRPMWIVPFAIIAAVSRGMTLAPRVEVFTQLACNALHHPYNYTSGSDQNVLGLSLSSVSAFFLPSVPQHTEITSLPIYFPRDSLETVDLDDKTPGESGSDDDDTDDPRRLPSQSCLSDPAVQAGAARLQTIMTTLMGILSALTTGWWGHLGERHGRVKILAASTLGLLLTDLAFILVSTPSSPFSHHGHILILLSPLTEGLLGGWATLQATTSAYVSDCTSDGSRSHIFARFTGVFYLGFSLGPTLGAFLIRHPAPWFESDAPHALAGVTHPRVGVPTVTTVFWAAILCSAINLFLTVFVLPESLDKARRKAALKAEADAAAGVQPVVKTAKPPQGGLVGLVKRAVGPLAIFAPKRRIVGAVDGFGGRKQRDWSLTWLALALFGYLLSMGIFQIKYLYAEHVYGWGAEQLSYYISFVGGARAVHLLFIMPFVISMFKPTTPVPVTSTPTPAALHDSISFDLALSRISLLLDITSHSLVALLGGQSSSFAFSGLTVLSSFASGVHPAVQSLAICIMQRNGHTAGLGPLFGALSFLQAVGQMILGPLVFGLVYSSTVARFPGAIFVLAAGLAAASLAFLLLVRAEPVPKEASSGGAARKGKSKARRREEHEPERGRSRTKKPVGEASGSRLVAPDV